MKCTEPVFSRLALVIALTLAAQAACAAPRGVPAGFEDLVAGQTEQLEVRLFGRSAGLVPVRVTLDHVQLEDPAAVLEGLDLSAEAQSALLPALSLPLARNSHLACRHGTPQAGCGYLDPPTALDETRVIHDEGAGALHLFIARQWVPGAPLAERFHRVTPGAENALLHQQSLNASGGAGQQAFTAQGAGALGVSQRGHLAVDWSFNHRQYRGRGQEAALRFDNAYYRLDVSAQYYLQAGRMDRRNLSSPQGGTFGFSMLPVDRFQGVRLGTTQAYVDTDAAVQAMPLTVLLARDARVDAFDGERLLQTFYLPAGVNQLDTRRFPYGSYPVSLRIYEDGVLVRSEDAPFDKGGDWANGSVQWFLQGGARDERRSERFDGELATMAGLRLPLGRAVAMTAGAAGLGDVSFGEMRLDTRYSLGSQDIRATLSGMRGSDGSSGQQHQLSYRRRAAWNLSQQRMRGKACQFQDHARDRLGCTDSLSISVALPVAGGTAYVAHTRRQTWSRGSWLPGDSHDPLSGLDPLLPPWHRVSEREPELRRTWQVSYNRMHRWHEFSVSSRIGAWTQSTRSQLREGRDKGVFINLGLTRLQRGEQGTTQRRYGSDYRQRPHQRPELDYSFGQTVRRNVDAQLREASLDVRGNRSDRYSAALSGRLDNGIGHTGMTVAHYRQPGRGETAYSATHSSGFALGSDGVYWGAGLGADAGLAVQVQGSDDPELSGVAAELQVGGLRRQRLVMGERRLLPLPAYQLHRAEVQDSSAAGSEAVVRVAGTGGARSLFMAPGRLVRMPVPIEVTYTFIGSALDSAGRPLSGARILNAPVAPTAKNGGFVADFPQRDSALYLLQGTQLLQCPLRVRERRSVVMLVGPVQCTATTVAQLPVHVLRQARVTRLLQENALIAAAPSRVDAGGRP